MTDDELKIFNLEWRMHDVQETAKKWRDRRDSTNVVSMSNECQRVLDELRVEFYDLNEMIIKLDGKGVLDDDSR